MYWIYDIPNWQLCILIMSSFATLAVVAHRVSHPLVHWIVGGTGKYNDVANFYFAGVSMLYGLTLGLIAVGTWQNFSDADSKVSKEANSLGALYRDLDGYPTEMRQETEKLLTEYVTVVIEQEWPAHRMGNVLDAGEVILEKLENRVMAFEPAGETQKLAHMEVIESLGELIVDRGYRVQSVSTALPGVLWAIVLLGAAITISLTFLFWVENMVLHSVLIGLIAATVGMLIFLTAAMDNPYRGEFSVSPDAFKYVLEHTMKPTAN